MISSLFESTNKCNNLNYKNFSEWFQGFCDAESNFTIRIRKKKDKILGFEFIFRISLHIDDLNVLEMIQEKLKCGRIRKNRNTYELRISSLKDIEEVIIPRFDNYPLMTKKYLDYLNFRKSFFIYKERARDEKNRYKYDLNILELKNTMNDKRCDFRMPDNHVRINANYLLGYIEGDGSFYFNKSDNTVRISLITIEEDRIVLEKMREFLFNQLDEHSLFLAKHTKLIFINNKNIGAKRKLISELQISQIDFICNILIPFFDNLDFKTKKYLDYLDFRKIAFLIFEGKHLSEKGRSLIIQLADTMNNSRLSTNLSKISTLDSNFNSDMELLLKSNALVNIDSEGRALIIRNNKLIRSTYIIEATFENGNIKYFPTGTSCAKVFNVSDTTISKRLNDRQPLLSKDRKILVLYLRRIKVYTKK